MVFGIPKRIIMTLILASFAFYGILNASWELLIPFCLFYSFIASISHNLILHRYFSHRSFSVRPFIHKLFTVLSVYAGMGSPITYRLDHRIHHMFSDTDKDIHGPKKGIFLALFSYKTENAYNINLEKEKDKLLVSIHKNYYTWFYSLSILVLLVFGFKLFCIYCLAVLGNIFVVGDMFNYTTHLKFPGTYRNFDTKDNSTNHWYWGFLNSNWHNNHHKYPNRCNEQIKWWEIDWLYQLIIRWVKQ